MKKKETRKCYKYNKVGYLIKNYRSGQKIKNRSVWKESNYKDKEDNDKEANFVKGLE